MKPLVCACRLVAASLAVPLPLPSLADDVRIVAPAAPGSAGDAVAQSLRAGLTDERGDDRATVANIPGGSGTTGLAQFLSDDAAGTLLVGGFAMVVAAESHRDAGSLDRLTPLARLADDPFVLVVAAKSPLRTFDDLKAALEADRTKVGWGGGPVGGTEHVATLMLTQALGLPPAGLPYGAYLGSADAAAAVGDDKVTVAFLGLSEVLKGIRDGKLRALAVATRAPVAGIDAPTFGDRGVSFVLSNWRGVFVRATLGMAARSRLAAQIDAVVKSPWWSGEIGRAGLVPAYEPWPTFGPSTARCRDGVRAALAAAGLQRT